MTVSQECVSSSRTGSSLKEASYERVHAATGDKVHSAKYGVNGVVRDYRVVKKLFFSYGGRNIEMAIDRNPLTGESFETLGQSIIDSYIDNLAAEERKIKLHYWYIDEQERGTEKYRLAHGICTGHPRLSDAMKIHTSNIQALHTDLENGELIVNTMNTEYHCPLAYCRWEKQDEYAHLIPEYEKLKETPAITGELLRTNGAGTLGRIYLLG